MDENLQEFLHSWAALLVFVLALGLLFIVLKSESGTIEALQKAIASDPTVYESRGDMDSSLLTGATLLFNVHAGLESDIEVEGTLISKDVNVNTFDYSIIDPKAYYSTALSLDESGKLTKVIYTKK